MWNSLKKSNGKARQISILLDLIIPFILFWSLSHQVGWLSASLLAVIVLVRFWIVLSG